MSRPEACQEAPAVLLNIAAAVRGNEAEVQAGGCPTAHSSAPRAKGMQQPGKRSQQGTFEPADSSPRDNLERMARQRGTIARGRGATRRTGIEFRLQVCYREKQSQGWRAEASKPQTIVLLSGRLVRLIEDHAEELTHGLLDDLATNACTPAYHRIPRDELHHRIYDVYRNLGEWLAHNTEESVEATYRELGKRRHSEEVPLSEVVCALTLTKYHLREFIRLRGLIDSAVELYQEQEFQRLVGRFFDRAIYYTVRGYESVAAPWKAVAAPRGQPVTR